MRLTNFSTLTFDCYGTLIDWEKGILNELRPLDTRHGLRLSDEQILEAFGEEESRAEATTPLRLYPEILADVLRALGKRWGTAAIEADAGKFGTSVGRWPAFADSAPALRYLKRFYKLVILSNVDRRSFAESNKQLEVNFDWVITAQDVGCYKPDRRSFEYALKTLSEHRIDRDQILHVAQSIFHDVVPAKLVGLNTLWINRRKRLKGWGATPPAHGDATPNLEVGSMAEFVGLHRAHLRGNTG